MASTTLKKITARAKHIRRIHGGTWKAAVKKAGAEYRAGKLGSVKKTARKKIIRRVKKYHAKEGRALRKLSGTLSAGGSGGVMGVRSTFRAASIGALSPSQHMAHARKKLEHEIGAAESRKFVAKKKSVKRKIAKRISALKSKFRKLC
jgi:hypothetical protein